MKRVFSAEDYISMHKKLHTPEVTKRLLESTVGIAGLGGLGSNAAVALARSGIGKLILVDFDKVEFSNLNRQCYTGEDVGLYKADALSRYLRKINPFTVVEKYVARITEENCLEFFKDADAVVEAVDNVESKRLIIETVLAESDRIPVVAATGIGGYGGNNGLKERRIGRLIIIGDEKTEVTEGVPLMAPRVGAAANMQANAVLEILMGTEK